MNGETLPDAIDAALRDARSAVRLTGIRGQTIERGTRRDFVAWCVVSRATGVSETRRDAYEHSSDLSLPEALSRRRVAIVARVLQRLGWDAADAFSVAIRESGTTGTARETVLRILGN